MLVIYTAVLAIILVVLILFLTMKHEKKEGFFFEVTPGKDRWCCDKSGYYGRPVAFEYSSDAERAAGSCEPSKQMYAFGQHGLLGQDVLGITKGGLGVPETVRRCDEPQNKTWN